MLYRQILILLFIIFTNNIFANCSDNNTQNQADACPNSMFYIKQQSISLASNVVLEIKNTGPFTASIQLIANFNGGSNLCGSNYTLQPKQSIFVTVDCEVGSFPYTLRDIDGRSNTITITEESSCLNEIGQPCKGGIIFQKKDSNNPGKIVTNLSNPEQEWNCLNQAKSLSFNDGISNTQNILAACPNDATPARVCNDLVTTNSFGKNFTGWYLPALNELTSIFSSQVISSTETKEFWSSTETEDSLTAKIYVFNFMSTIIADSEKFTDKQAIMCVNTF